MMDTAIGHYADVTALYACDKNLDIVIGRLMNGSIMITQWFADNFMKMNADNYHLQIRARNSDQRVTVDTGDSVLENVREEKVLGFFIDNILHLKTYITKLCKKAGNQLFTLACTP